MMKMLDKDKDNGDLVMADALWEVELKRRKIKGLMAELDTIVIPMIAWKDNKKLKIKRIMKIKIKGMKKRDKMGW